MTGWMVLAAVLAWAPRLSKPFSEAKLFLLLMLVGVALVAKLSLDLPNKFRWAIWLYLAAMLPSVVFSSDVVTSVFGYYGIFNGSVMTTFLCLAGLCLARPDPDESKVVRWAGYTIAAHAVLQHVGLDPLGMGPLPAGRRAISFVGSPVDLGALFVALMALERHPLFLAGAWATGSRGSWLGCAVMLAPARWRPAAAVLAATIGLAGTFYNGSPSDLARIEIWRAAVIKVTALGTGPATFGKTFLAHRTQRHVELVGPGNIQVHAHNIFLEYLSTRGLVGCLGLLAFLVCPALAGVWVVGLFNPISFEIVFVACVVAGLITPREAPGGQKKGPKTAV